MSAHKVVPAEKMDEIRPYYPPEKGAEQLYHDTLRCKCTYCGRVLWTKDQIGHNKDPATAEVPAQSWRAPITKLISSRVMHSDRFPQG